MTRWILVADASKARLYSVSGQNELVRLERVFEHSQSRLRTRDLVSDSSGRFNKSGAAGTRSAIAQDHTAHDHEAERFADELAHVLDRAVAENQFSDLAIIAPAHFLGALRLKLSKEANQRIRLSLGQELMSLKDTAIQARVEEVLKTHQHHMEVPKIN